MTRTPEWNTFSAEVERVDEARQLNAAARTWSVRLALLCLAALWLLTTHIAQSMPYPRDIDEGFVSGPANRMVVAGTLHPYTFNYPSLPKYLAAAGMAAGFLRSASNVEIRDVAHIGSVGYPYYDTPRVMETARQLFALLAVITLAATGAAAWHAFRKPATIFVAPLVLMLFPLFVHDAWAYLNVDIVACCFATLALAVCLHGTREPSLSRSAVVPGALIGLAAGSKYTLAVFILPMLLSIVLHVPRGRRFGFACACVAAMAVAFVAAVPYSVIDIPGFLNGVGAEAFHYASGHEGFTVASGWRQWGAYVADFARQAGVIGIAMAAFAWLMVLFGDWTRFLLLGSFPLVLLALLGGQRVHFDRNILALLPLVAMLTASGVVWLQGRLTSLLTARGITAERGWIQAAVAIVAFAIVAPVWHAPDELRSQTDSRRAAERWMTEHVPPNWTIAVPAELQFDTRALGANRHVVGDLVLQSLRDPHALDARLSSIGTPAVVLLPRWGADPRFPHADAPAALNAAQGSARVLASFGTNPVLTNYSDPVPWGDPAFSIVAIGADSTALR